jgi:RNA polymerase sigma-B factor
MHSVSAAERSFSRAQTAELQRAYHDNRNLHARERLIEAYLPLVRALAQRFTHRGERLEDLVQVGSIGLIKAVDRFEPDRGVGFAAFAAPNIVGEIKRHLRDRATLIRVPRRHQEAGARLRAMQRELRNRLGRDPTSLELAAAAHPDELELAEADQGARSPLPLSEAGPTVSAEDPYRTSEDRIAVSAGLRRLHRREREVVRYRYFADMSQAEIAARLGISQTQTSRLLASGLAKLRVDLDEKKGEFSGSRRLNSWYGDSRRRHGRAA